MWGSNDRWVRIFGSMVIGGITIMQYVVLSLLLTPFAVYASTEHFCGFDHRQFRRGISPIAAKRPMNLNAGEPRTVRVVLFSPSDRTVSAGLVDTLRTQIKRNQEFFAEQMEACGYGPITFRIETNSEGEVLIHHVKGKNPESHYFELEPGVLHAHYYKEIEQVFALEENIYVLYRDITRNTGPATGWRDSKKAGAAELFTGVGWKVLAHELGHAFGLPHDFRDGAYMLSYGGETKIPGATSWDRISKCAAEFLSVHPYFNSTVSLEESSPPTFELVSPKTYRGDLKQVSIEFQVNDTEGIHQIIFEAYPGGGYGGLRECRTYKGRRDLVAEFEYDGTSMAADPQLALTSLSDSLHYMQFMIVDIDGNLTESAFTLTSDRSIDVLRGHTDAVNTVAFSTDDKTLASGSDDGTVKLWNFVNQQLSKTLWNSPTAIKEVTFSKDGTLAVGNAGGEIRLWDLSSPVSSTVITGLTPIAFSPDGTVLTSVTRDHTITLREPESSAQIKMLIGHSTPITAIAFSSDGTLLVSGSAAGSMRLWNIGKREEITSIDFEMPIHSVAFSPDDDGLVVAIETPFYGIRLMEINPLRHVRGLWTEGPILSVVYSPDKQVLSAGGDNGSIFLWDSYTLKHHGTFRSTSAVRALAFSPGGTTLAVGLENHTIKLRDVSKWSGSPDKVALQGDFDNDGTVGFGDFVIFARAFGKRVNETGYDAKFDLDGDGLVGFSDFVIFAQQFGGGG